jgi:hypothetical protein
MKKILLSFMLPILFTAGLKAQTLNSSASVAAFKATNYVYGIRAGLNISNITQGASIGARSKFGLVAGVFADQSIGKLKGMRDEITYSREGFKFKNSHASGSVDLQYLYITHLFTLNFGNIAQLHAGPQVGFLVNAIGDSIRNLNSSNASSFFSITNQTNRLNYGGCAGLEIYPWKGLLIGGRYNLSFSNINRKEASSYQMASRSITANNNRFKNEVWNIVVGWRFGRGINTRN